jgi:hypothetical protein
MRSRLHDVVASPVEQHRECNVEVEDQLETGWQAMKINVSPGHELMVATCGSKCRETQLRLGVRVQVGHGFWGSGLKVST